MGSASISVDRELCVGCGACAADCPQNEISILSGKAAAASLRCIRCGHCAAVCPQNAVRLLYTDELPKPIESPRRLSPQQLQAVLYQRRSIRRFKEQSVPEEVLAMILDAGRVSHTGRNRQGLCFTVLSERRAEAEAAGVRFFRGIKKLGSPFSAYLRWKTIPDDFLFYGAPIAVVVSGESETDCVFAAANMEYMAEANGLGVLVSGFFTIAAKHSPALIKLLALPKGHTAMTTLVMGWPDVNYLRTAPREPLRVNRL